MMKRHAAASVDAAIAVEAVEFRQPDLHVHGVPCRQVCVGVNADGIRSYEIVAIDIPPEVPSAYWREGA
jgi:hypothetical protein